MNRQHSGRPIVGWEHGRHIVGFGVRVVRGLYRSHGLLLAAAIAFDTLLSLVPLLSLVLVLVSYAIEPDDARQLISSQVSLLLPGAAGPVNRAYAAFLEQRDVVGGLGFLGLVFFGALAFHTAKDALDVLFGPHRSESPRHPAAMLLPLLYVVLTVLTLLLGTAALIALDALPERGLSLLGTRVELADASRALLRVVGFVAQLVLFSSLYRVLPGCRAAVRHVLCGGLVAASIWELVRRVLVWYFAHLSLVGAFYGSLASVVILLVSLDVGAVVFLLGGQVVVELTASAMAGVPWHQRPRI